MAMARTFERQGHYSQAKSAYQQVLASQPDYPEARQSLETLIANEANPERLKKGAHPYDQRKEMLAQAKALAEKEAREMAAREEERSPKLAKRASAKRAKSVERDDIETSRNLAASAGAPISSDSVKVSYKPDLNLNESEVESTPLTTTKPAETRSSDRTNSYAQDRETKGQSFVGGTAPKSSRASAQPEISSQEIRRFDESLSAANGQSSPNHNAPGTELAISGDRYKYSAMPQSVAAREVSRETLPSSAAENWDLTATSNVPELQTAPEPALVTDAELATGNPRSDSMPFEKPIIRQHPLAEQSLEQFFGPFHMGMVESIRANRDQFQSKLAELVSDQDADIELRSRSVFLLGSIGPAAVDVVPALRREMHYEIDEYLRIDLCEALLKIQPEDEDAINVLVESLKETDENLRWIAAFALRNAVSPRTTFVIDSLRESLNTQDLKLRRMIFLTLAEFGPAAEKAIPELEAALESTDPATREVAKASLACIAPDRKTTKIIQETSHRSAMPVNQ
jgi:hypothetical protein